MFPFAFANPAVFSRSCSDVLRAGDNPAPNRRPVYCRITLMFFVAILAVALGGPVVNASGTSRPNVLLILADDMGYGDLSCYGHPQARTPHIDQLARAGMRFTQHYSNGPECTPTRVALLTGRYPQRVLGLECAIGTGNVGRYDEAVALAEDRRLGLRPTDTVLPGRLIEQGYRCGVFGKWHLGYEPKFHPGQHGWQRFFGYLGGNVHYFNHRETSDLHVLFNDELPVYREGYMTHLITDAAINFIETSREQPFFAYVAHESPHFPFQGPGDGDKVVTRDNWMEADQDAYVAMLEDLDSEVGRLLRALKEKGLSDNTLVIFVSDNGGYGPVAHMAPLRGAKSSTWEGGIRVPLLVRWPGKVPAGVESSQVSATFDLTRSILEAAGAGTEQLDGMDLIGHVRKGHNGQQAADLARTLFWRGRRGTRTWRAVRHGDMKLVEQTNDDNTQTGLYDLRADISESHDLSETQPDTARRLHDKLREWEEAVDSIRP